MLLSLDGDGALYQQVYRALRGAILDGSLKPGAKLPATRALARELAVAGNTRLGAYSQLEDEGYVSARTGSGTYVAATLPEERVAVSAPKRSSHASVASARGPQLSEHARRILAQAPRAGVSWG